MFVACVMAVIVAGFFAVVKLAARPRPSVTVQRIEVLTGAEARALVATHEAQNQFSAFIHRRMRAEVEAKGYHYEDNAIVVIRRIVSRTPAPPANIVERLQEWFEVPVHAQERQPSCDTGGGSFASACQQ